MIALIVITVLLAAAVIVLVFQRNAARNRAEDPVEKRLALEEVNGQLLIANGELIADKTRLEMALSDKDREVSEAMERMATEAQHQIEAHQHSLELAFAERRRAENAASNLRSRGALIAKITEHMTPYLAGFPFNPKDARHFGEVFDFLVFDGLEDGGPVTIVFLEIKTSTSGRTRRVTNPRERKLRDAIKAGRVRYQMWQPSLDALDALARAEEVPAIEGGSGVPGAVGGAGSGVPPADGALPAAGG